MQKRFIPLAVLIAAVLALLLHLGMHAAATPVFSYAKERPAAEARRIYLTFDDGPSTAVTNRVLDTLRREGVHATFFIVSDRAHGREETLRRIVREGHTVGVHSATHRYDEIYASDRALVRDAETCAALIRRVTGVQPQVYRFPGGGTADNGRRAALLTKLGFRIVSWNAVCGDEEIARADADTLYKTAVSTAAGKDPVVLLMHDSAGHAATAEALPRIIAHFRARGYVFCAY